jgi:hypothetical protein
MDAFCASEWRMEDVKNADMQEASWFRQDQGTQGTREPKGTQDPWQREIYQEIKWWCDDVICILMGMLTDFCVVFLM